VPVTEGDRYRVGEFTFDGNTVIKSEGLQGVLRVKPGTFYSEKKIRKSLEKAREVYGSLGYYEFTAYPTSSRASPRRPTRLPWRRGPPAPRPST
jgi:outer membrane protein assembly factor BamA